ncbi:MAG: DUF1926 domain-containing protein [Candidatus Aminicenantes bacterium]|nr:DUF1926 domain-containing protein [Candidatus Aminicenantes bacterium]
MPELAFLWAVHNHQPIGNFPSVIEKAFDDSYFPFLQNLAKYPEIKFSLHFSGPLWEYMEIHRPEVIKLLQSMIERNQIELLGGAFYEPILAIIPEWDRRSQLLLMADYLEKKFGIRPQGAWIAERVWEPQLARTLAEAGYKFTLLDEEHFYYAGLINPRFPFITEDQGFPLVIFPIDKRLRYLIPFHPPEEIDAYFHQLANSGNLAILGDDGEKFGLWPGTKNWVYEAGWLDSFLNYLRTSKIKTLTFSEFLATKPKLKLVYLPPASYEEMMEWILNREQLKKLRELKNILSLDFRRLIRGGFFREFFLKYPESHHLHKRVLQLSKFIEERKIKNEIVLKNLYRSQCNDAYWHGVFGGLYLPHLRQAVYFHLLEAEKAARVKAGWELIDFDCDSQPEIFYRNQTYNLIFKPTCGGSLIEFDYLPYSRNLTNVLSRWPESYHQYSTAATEGKSIHELARKLPENYEIYFHYDKYRRTSLLDHFFDLTLTFEKWTRREYQDVGDFFEQEYDFNLRENYLYLEKEGMVRLTEKDFKVFIRKTIIPKSKNILIEYNIQNKNAETLDCFFGQEWNFYLLPDEWELKTSSFFLLKRKIQLSFQPEPQFWITPLETLSQSEKDFEIIYQGINLLALWRLYLKANENFIFSIMIEFENGE